MKFDILAYLENYKVLTEIAGSATNAMWMCAAITIVVWLLSYGAVGWLFGNIFGFRGHGKAMSVTYSIISTIISGLFYGFLETFLVPIVWIRDNFILIVVIVSALWILTNVVPWIIGKIQEKKNEQ